MDPGYLPNLTLSPNICEPYRKRYPGILDNAGLQILLGILYTCVWVAGVGGNVVVVYVALAKRFSFSLRTVFILSLSCSDLVVAMTSLPITSITLLSHNWLFPNFLCKIISFVQACGIFQSSFTLTAIAVDRFWVIFYPHKSIITYRRATIATLLMCCHGMLLASPMAIFTRIVRIPSICGVFCQEDWGDLEGWARRSYGSAVLTLQFGLPLLVSSFCYWRISRHLHGRVTQRLRHEVILPEAMKRLDERRSRTNRMMVVMMLSFFFTWFPFNLLNILRDFEPDEWPLLTSSLYDLLYAFMHLTAMTSLIWNPIIYAGFNESFREAIRSVFRPTAASQNFKSGFASFRESNGKIKNGAECRGAPLSTVVVSNGKCLLSDVDELHAKKGNASL